MQQEPIAAAVLFVMRLYSIVCRLWVTCNA